MSNEEIKILTDDNYLNNLVDNNSQIALFRQIDSIVKDQKQIEFFTKQI
jgi:hypothetical protein